MYIIKEINIIQYINICINIILILIDTKNYIINFGNTIAD